MPTWLRVVAVLAACAAIAVAVEYAQVYVAPRTVSRNDLLAEFLGAAAGVVLWLVAGERLLGLVCRVASGGGGALQAAAALYGLAYVAVALFPFDFVSSRAELTARLAAMHPLLGPCGGLRCVLKLAAEVVIAVPLGLLLAARLPAPRAAWGAAAGALLGLTLEAAQVLLASGVVQGVSVVTRTLGVALGAALFAHVPWARLRQWRGALRPLVLLAVPAYVLLLILVGGWHREKLGLIQALAELKPAAFLPFYFHYFTSESAAVMSLLSNAALYAPVGLACAAWWWAGGAQRRAPVGAAAGWGAVAALLVEAGHLLSPVKHADPTNLLIAAAVAAGVCAGAAWMIRGGGGAAPGWMRSVKTGEPALADAAPPIPAASSLSRAPQRAIAISAAVAVAAALWHFPVYSAWLAAGLALYGAVLWRYPSAWLCVVPAALPVLNLSSASGWLLTDEFDLLVLVTLAVGLWRAPVSLRALGRMGVPLGVLGVLTLSYALSAGKGLWPFQPPDATALFSYHTPYNALRVGKAWLWALALALLLTQSRDVAADVRRWFLPGVVVGLGGVCLAVLWERHLFSGVLNFSGDFRATGGLAAMHVGGPYIEVYLVLAITLALWAAVSKGAWWWRLAAVGTVAMGSYALAVTYSRGGYLGFAIALMATAVFALAGRRRVGGFSTPLITGAALSLVAVVALPVLMGGHAQSRLSQTLPDLAQRAEGWRADWEAFKKEPSDLAVGAGLGTYPSIYLWRHAEDGRAPATFRYVSQKEESFVRLGAGTPVYLGQRVDVQGGAGYRLELRLRSDAPADLAVPVCEKSLLYSSRCAWTRMRVPGSGEWHTFTFDVDMKNVGTQINGVRRPVEFAMFNGRRGTLVDVDRVSLTKSGRELLVNGDFTRAGSRWFFNTDAHDAWHPRSLALEILIAQGLLGVVAVGALLAVTLARLPRARLGEIGPAVLGGAAGAFAIGVFDGWWDAPRLVMLLYLGLLLALASGAKQAKTGT